MLDCAVWAASAISHLYQNVNCILSYKNLGMGSGNNLGIKLSKTDYVFILNPDVILEYNTIDQLILASETISDFTILSPISKDNSYPNYKLDNNGINGFHLAAQNISLFFVNFVFQKNIFKSYQWQLVCI